MGRVTEVKIKVWSILFICSITSITKNRKQISTTFLLIIGSLTITTTTKCKLETATISGCIIIARSKVKVEACIVITSVSCIIISTKVELEGSIGVIIGCIIGTVKAKLESCAITISRGVYRCVKYRTNKSVLLSSLA